MKHRTPNIHIIFSRFACMVRYPYPILLLGKGGGDGDGFGDSATKGKGMAFRRGREPQVTIRSPFSSFFSCLFSFIFMRADDPTTPQPQPLSTIFMSLVHDSFNLHISTTAPGTQWAINRQERQLPTAVVHAPIIFIVLFLFSTLSPLAHRQHQLGNKKSVFILYQQQHGGMVRVNKTHSQRR